MFKQEFFTRLPVDLQEERKAEIQTVEMFELWYNSNGRRVKGFVVSPRDRDTQYPVVLYARGGSKEYGKITERVLLFVLTRIASWGFVVLATQYSGNDGSEGKDELSGMDLDDVENLKNVAEELEYADENNIQAIGMSRGGLMVANLWRRVSWLKGVILEVPELDLIDNYQRIPKLKEYRSDMYDVNNDALNRIKSPIYHIDEFHSATKAMIIQGGKDQQVNPQKSIEFFRTLREAGIVVDLHFFAEEDHQTQGVHREIKQLWKEFLLKNR